ncbi:MAG: tetratricopeptide repeat protein [Sphingobacteriales bacterium]|nr:tetratricopeptide repeat protein [Sphingobacteriales bacterium]
MLKLLFSLCVLLAGGLIYSQTAVNTVNVPIDSAGFFMQKGLLEKQNGRRLESLKNFEKAARYDTSSKAIITELASAYHDLRKYGNALQMYKKLLAAGEETPALYKQLMQLCYQMKQQEELIVYAEKLRKLDPSEKVSFYIGKAHYETDNYGEAIKYLNAAAKEDPANAEVPYMIARSYADMMNYKLAVPFFKKAIELDPKQNYWVYELGLICYAMHDDKNALKYILEAAEKGLKKDADYLENLAIAYLNVGQLDSGVAMLNEILVKRPSDLNILNMVAEAYYYKAKYDQAIEYWDRVLEYDKENASALYMIGMSYQKKGGRENTEKGIALCDKAIELDPTLASLKQKKMTAGL